jgi:hypothetical protein
MILIGSNAIKSVFPDFPRDPKDKDYLVENRSIYKSNKDVEYHENPILLDYLKTSPLDANTLYTLKVSHLFWDVKWDKHMFDIVFLRKKGCELNQLLFSNLYKYWSEIHGNPKKSNLSMSVDSFFDNGLKSDLDHDYLHTLINPSPLYLKTKIDHDTVETSMDLWKNLSEEDKLELIREECYVMAYERLWGRDYRAAYVWQLKELILKHLPLDQGLFAIENYDKLRKPTINYKQKLNYELQRTSRSLK